jgi:hypothetical protein
VATRRSHVARAAVRFIPALNVIAERGPSLALAVRVFVLVIALVLAVADGASAQQTSGSELPPGWVMPSGLVAEPGILRRAVNASDRFVKGDGERKDGPYAEFGSMITGAGWISAGPGYRHHVLGGRALVDASAALSSRLYKVAQARFELPGVVHQRLSLGVQALYQDLLRVSYFGLGSSSLESDRSRYRLNNTSVLGHAGIRATAWLSADSRFGWIGKPDVTLDRLSESEAPGIRMQPSFLYNDASIAADWRDHPEHPTRGGLYRAAAASYSDRDAGTYSFRRYELETSQFIPLFGRRWVIALHGWEVFSDPSKGSVVPFYLLPSLGGGNTLRGYRDYRFHDNHMQSFNAESRLALFTHMDVAAFVDAGKVAAHAGDLDFRHLKTSYGAGLRVHNATSALVRLDVAHGTEGWRVSFRLTDPFKRSTPASGRPAVIPFVP